MLNSLLESWTSIYANHAALRTAVDFAHIGGLVAGGGCAIAADLATFRTRGDGDAAKAAHLTLLKRTHPIVVFGLAALFISGLLQVGADLETFLHSRIFWLKMGLVALLLINGTWVLALERQAALGEPRAWPRLHVAATTSLLLWGLTTLAGAALPNIG